MIGFLTSLPSAIFFSIAQQILCKKETGDVNLSPGDHFSFDFLLSSLSKIFNAAGPSQNAPLNAVLVGDTGNPESSHCNEDSTGKDAQAPPDCSMNMSWYNGLQNLQVLSFSPSGFPDISVDGFSNSLSAKEGKGEISHLKTDTTQLGYLQYFLKNHNENTGNTRTEFTQAMAEMSSTPADRIMVTGTEHRYSAPGTETASEIDMGIASQRSTKITSTPPSPLPSREGTSPQSSLVRGEKGGYSFLLGDDDGDISGSARNNAHPLQEWFTISDERINGREGGIVPGALMRQGNGETKQEADAPSLHNLHSSFHESIPSSIVSNEPSQKEGTHEVLSVSPGLKGDGTGLPNEKIHLMKSGNTITIHIEPEGLGKLNIHLNLERGMLHTLINASHDTVRDFLREQSWHIMNTLMQDGLNVGSFSVSLNGGGMGWESPMFQKQTSSKPSEEKESEPVQDFGSGLISIFI
jgi:Flagellar hook-length control protein FliK